MPENLPQEKGKRVAFHTLGCKVNQYETEAMAELFRRHGYQVVDFGEKADVYVINTCTVTHLGDRKSRQMVRRASRQNPAAVVAVAGCYAQTAPGEVLAIPGVDVVIGTADRARIVDLVEGVDKAAGPVAAVGDIREARTFEEMPFMAAPGRTRAYLKIQEGCNNFCSYCIIPYARGPVRSRQPEHVLQEARRLVEQGFRELILTGIHTGSYGQDLGEGKDLTALVEDLVQIPGLQRLRLSSIEPNEVTRGLVEIMAHSGVFCHHLHIPLQSGDDFILQRMNRHYNTKEYARLVAYVRQQVPDVAITTDVIVGFPGEEGENFRHTVAFIRDVGFSNLHVFKFSPRKGTPAATFSGQVDARNKEKRSQELLQLADELARAYAGRFLGRQVEVLVEGRTDDGLLEGLTGNYLRAAFSGPEDLIGNMVLIEVDALDGASLRGRILSPRVE